MRKIRTNPAFFDGKDAGFGTLAQWIISRAGALVGR
jgi:hypothetical protein